MIPQKTNIQIQSVREHHLNSDPFVLSMPFAILLLPLLMAIYIKQRCQHKQQVLQQQIEQLEKLWKYTPRKDYS